MEITNHQRRNLSIVADIAYWQLQWLVGSDVPQSYRDGVIDSVARGIACALTQYIGGSTPTSDTRDFMELGSLPSRYRIEELLLEYAKHQNR